MSWNNVSYSKIQEKYRQIELHWDIKDCVTMYMK